MSKELTYIPESEFERIKLAKVDPVLRAGIYSSALRFNILHMIQMAGSGHIGTSFSCIDLLTWLYLEVLENANEADGDVCFSSKGHDAPALYSLLISLGRLPERNLHQLRRLEGLPGHPDVATPGIVTNTGSLGMGISKARGMAAARRISGKKKRQIYVIFGDGELQEGQFWESLQPTANGRYAEVTGIVDHNKFQSDLRVSEVSDLGDLEAKVTAFGWIVGRCDGNSIADFSKTLENIRNEGQRQGKPQLIIADTVKGRGVSFMEGGQFDTGELYAYHSGAPSVELHQKAQAEILRRIQDSWSNLGISDLVLSGVPPTVKPSNSPQAEALVKAYGQQLKELGANNSEIVVLDGDLMLDCGLIPFRDAFPNRFIECGIAEQDMVSMAGGLALSGCLPIVHSFSCFLSSRPNEQIYNNATERTRVIYVGSLAGLLPSAPGHSHQCVREISSLGDVPGLVMLEPACERESKSAISWAVNSNQESSYLRLVTIPVETNFTLPADYELRLGQGTLLTKGKDIICFGYGPWMLTEIMAAAEMASRDGINITVCDFPWLNRFDSEWLSELVEPYSHVLTFDNHYVGGGQGVRLSATLGASGALQGKSITNIGLTDIPRSGQPGEVMAHHRLDRDNFATLIREKLSQTKIGSAT